MLKHKTNYFNELQFNLLIDDDDQEDRHRSRGQRYKLFYCSQNFRSVAFIDFEKNVKHVLTCFLEKIEY